MPELKLRLDRFTASVLSEATHEAEAALQTLEQKRRKALAAAERKALNDSYQAVHNETARIRAEKGREISRHMLENQRALALRREEIARSVFDKVVQRLSDYTASPDYEGRLLALFRQAVQAVGGSGPLVVYLRPEDLGAEAALRRSCAGRPLEVRPGAFRLGGLIVDCPEQNLRADQTFDCSLQSLEGHFAELFGLSLSSDGGPEEE